jgi:hypothetical protein
MESGQEPGSNAQMFTHMITALNEYSDVFNKHKHIFSPEEFERGVIHRLKEKGFVFAPFSGSAASSAASSAAGSGSTATASQVSKKHNNNPSDSHAGVSKKHKSNSQAEVPDCNNCYKPMKHQKGCPIQYVSQYGDRAVQVCDRCKRRRIQTDPFTWHCARCNQDACKQCVDMTNATATSDGPDSASGDNIEREFGWRDSSGKPIKNNKNHIMVTKAPGTRMLIGATRTDVKALMSLEALDTLNQSE